MTFLPRGKLTWRFKVINLEDAYSAVLCAFKAQSDALTWEKESLITELGIELRVSDEEHREDWRETGIYQPPGCTTSQPVHDILPSPTVSASNKKPKTSHSGQSLPGLSSVKPVQCASTGPTGARHFSNHNSSSNLNAPAEEAQFDPLIGKKVWTRWPEDSHFYEAVITDYNPDEISPEDIRWEGEDPGAGRGKGHPRFHSRKELMPPQDGIGNRVPNGIKLLNTDSLVKVFAASHPDSVELEKAKPMLKEHEQALVDIISRIADASDGESDGEQPYSHGQLMERG
ncbi:emsy amine-terminus (ENT)/plant tudor-like domain protein [Medicago truncatula]|uniref:Emsy amine-terminus (ENT)/plant tudor-like domain protein n=1 Tax=Medicago truncatula TaxID=3880 RepID=G7JIW0_MEDTR|nr:emsy amine-terminus (ENT)/plant tudor-like domain protein [Medicago truncatula]